MCSLGGWTRGCRPTARPCYFLLSCCCCGCSWTKWFKDRGKEEENDESESSGNVESRSCELRQIIVQTSPVAARESDAAADPEKKPREPTATDPLLCEGEAPPSMDEIQSWGKSFDHLMRNAAGRKVFRDFLRGEYSEENIMFWLACEELKRETDPDAVEEKARFIYEDYISILSPKEVSLDSHVREIVNRNMVEPTPHTFDEAQLQIYTLMHRDSYPRFVNSTIYKTLAAINDEPAAL